MKNVTMKNLKPACLPALRSGICSIEENQFNINGEQQQQKADQLYPEKYELQKNHQHQQQKYKIKSKFHKVVQQKKEKVENEEEAKTSCRTMPAMPKEKVIAVSLSERNFNEFKIKELSTTNITSAFTSTTTEAAAVAMATTSTANNISVANNRLQQEQQQQQQFKNNTCGCGARSAAIESVVGHSNKLQQQQQQQYQTNKITMQHQNHKNVFPTSSAAALKHACCRTQIHKNDENNVGDTDMTTHFKTVKSNNNNYYNNNNNNNYYYNNISPKRNSGYCQKIPYSNYMSGNSTSTNSSISSNSSSYSRGGDSPNPSSVVNETKANTNSIGIGSASATASGSGNASVNESNSVVVLPKKSPKDFIFGKYIGEGSYSIVYLAVDVNTKKEYAIKVCEKRHILREHKQDYIRREREVMHIMTNVPGFVNLSCTFQDHRSLYFVMTYAKNGDMLPYINKVGSFDLDCTRHYAAELVLACENMHNRHVVHRDLKPENILLDESMHILIADFGSAKIMLPDDNNYDDDDDDDNEDNNDDYDDNNRKSVNVRKTINTSTSTSSTSGSDGDNDAKDAINTPDMLLSLQKDKLKTQQQKPKQHKMRNPRKRKGSFVGTAQYVSPEVLNNKKITPAADLWALGCIIYQMIAGLPPYRGSTDYLIFKEILANTLEFPDGFDGNAKDLVKKLLKLNAMERLGAHDIDSGIYTSIRQHAFFTGIDFDNIRQCTPPPIHPYLPGVSQDESDNLFSRTPYSVPENLEPGLDDRQITRLLGIELGTVMDKEILSLTDHDDDHYDDNNTSNEFDNTILTRENDKEKIEVTSLNLSSTNSTNNTNNETTVPVLIAKDANNDQYDKTKNNFDLTPADKQKRLEQQKCDVWNVFVDNEVILRKGLVNKRKGLFARKRMLLLTTGPRLIYIDPVQMVKKGEIPWSIELRVEPKNFKIFFVHTPNRTYYLEDPEGYALQWVNAIRKIYALTYKNELKQQQKQQQQLHEEEGDIKPQEQQQKTSTENNTCCSNSPYNNSGNSNNASSNINNTILPITMKTNSLIYKKTTGFPNKSLNSDNSNHNHHHHHNNNNNNYNSSNNNSYNTVITPINTITTTIRTSTTNTMTKSSMIITTTTTPQMSTIKALSTTMTPTTPMTNNHIENLTNSIKSAAIVITANKMPTTTTTKTRINATNTQAKMLSN